MFNCTSDDFPALTTHIQYGTSVLLRDSHCIDKGFIKKRNQNDGFNDTVPSFFRPPLLAHSRSKHLKRQREEKLEVRDTKLKINNVVIAKIAILI